MKRYKEIVEEYQANKIPEQALPYVKCLLRHIQMLNAISPFPDPERASGDVTFTAGHTPKWK
jgi:hypothetical protein